MNDYGKDAEVTYLLNKFDWFIIPVANPDGYEYSMTTVSVAELRISIHIAYRTVFGERPVPRTKPSTSGVLARTRIGTGATDGEVWANAMSL